MSGAGMPVGGAVLDGEDDGEEGTIAVPLAQRLAEELVVDMVRQAINVPGLLTLELDVIAALGGEPLDAKGHPTPMAMLAAALLDHAFHRVEQEWREGRALAAADNCVCCVLEQQAEGRKKATKARKGKPS